MNVYHVFSPAKECPSWPDWRYLMIKIVAVLVNFKPCQGLRPVPAWQQQQRRQPTMPTMLPKRVIPGTLQSRAPDRGRALHHPLQERASRATRRPGDTHMDDTHPLLLPDSALLLQLFPVQRRSA